MKLNRQSRSRILILGACVFPLAAGGASHWGNALPQETKHPATASTTSLQSQVKQTNETPAARAEWAEAWREGMRLRSASEGTADPFYRSTAERNLPEREHEVLEEPAPAPEQFAHSLDGMMGGEEPVAIIDGKVRRLGDEIGDGWVITAIDLDARTVTVREHDGSEQVLRER